MSTENISTDVDFAALLATPEPEAAKEQHKLEVSAEPQAEAPVEEHDEDTGWDEPKADGFDDEDEEESDELPPDPSDERESWRKNRLNAVKTQRDKAREAAAAHEAEAAAARKELADLRAKYESGKTPEPAQAATGAPSLDQIQAYVANNDPVVTELARKVALIKDNADKFKDAGSYADALTEALTDYKTELKIRTATIQSDLRNREAAKVTSSEKYVENLLTNYDKVVKESSIPKIEVYSKRLIKHATDLHPMIREAILTHENPDVATAAVTSNRQSFDWLVEQSKRAGNGPLSPRAVAYVGELVASYKTRKADAPAHAPVEKPKAKPSTPPVPRTVRSSNGGSGSSATTDMDPFVYARKVLSGEIKDPALASGR